MNAALADGCRLGLILKKPQAAADATGLSADGRSSHYAQRQIQTRRQAKMPGKSRLSKRYRMFKWPKITAVIDTASHLIAAAHFSEGPGHDSPPFLDLVRQAQGRVHFDQVLA